jgi:riboflavin-specific deaminase-like protein
MDTEDGPVAKAWLGLKAAARWAREQPHATRTALGLDASGALRPVPIESEEALLLWQPADGWVPFPHAASQALPLLDLYLPMCVAAPGRPVTVGHLGQGLDGYIATDSGDSNFVTGPENILHLHRMRALCDAVVVGAQTVARDDPRLTTRLAAGTNPVRVVLDPRRRLGADRRVFADGEAETLLVCTPDAGQAPPPGQAELLSIAADDRGLQLDALLDALHARGLLSVFVEGGGATVSGFLQAGLLDRLHVAIAPIVTGRGRPGLRIAARDRIDECLRPRHRVFAMGSDVLFDCDLRAPPVNKNNIHKLRRVL